MRKPLLLAVLVSLATFLLPQAASAQNLDEAAARLEQRARTVDQQAHEDLEHGTGNHHVVQMAHQLVEATEALHSEIDAGHDFGPAWERVRAAWGHLRSEVHDVAHSEAMDNDIERFEVSFDAFEHALEHHHHHDHHDH